ncbi:uncharacterized protein LY79DRAFT_671017 [Colletotrichum navitas]|uniref:Uncharacterized protein n=1 Tax=Colletotrichum navitas TaxID=681940 RepID=A0AAD8V1J8_9PEZI|nr:uncharacterized protein LY79DRAFT_671017 [Colletotrichum navitas]KAK1585411.1 hypothetical protein LY79DRAFT_671017 [Colletotrichum navitas]
MAARKTVPKATTARKTVPQTKTARKTVPKPAGTKNPVAKRTTTARNTPARRTAAHALSAALRNDEVPTDPRVLAAFGFDRCFSGPDRAHLSMVYAALMVDLGVRPHELNKWLAGAGDGDGDGRGEGEVGLKHVGERIRARFAAAKPGRLRPGPHLAWFRDHQYVWDDDAPGRAKAEAAARRMINKNLAALRKKVKKGERDEVFDWWS